MDLILHMDQILQPDQNPHMIIIVLTPLFRRVELRAMNMSFILQIIMFISPRRISLLIHILTLPLLCETKWTRFYATFIIWCSQSDEFFATPPDVGGEEKELISSAGSGLQTCSKRLKNLLET